MPIYEFHCEQCGHEFETLVLRSSEKIECAQCGSEKTHRMMSVFSSKSEGKYRSSSGSSCSTCTASTCTGCSSGSGQ